MTSGLPRPALQPLLVGAYLFWHDCLGRVAQQMVRSAEKTMNDVVRLVRGTRRHERRTAMEIIIVGLGFMFALWIAVIWGSNLFNKNMQ